MQKACGGATLDAGDLVRFKSNARMYAVSPEAEAAWEKLLARVAEEAGVELDYLTYAAPQPLEALWRRADVGCVQMCGYPIALKVADVVPLASPIPAAQWAAGKPVYRTDLIVRADARYEDIADTFEGTVGWTVEHSHSGFNALRYHLLPYRSPERPRLYKQSVGGLVTARRVLDSVLDGTIDVGPLDAYWHMLMRKYDPGLTDGVRVIQSTATAPMPAFVASPSMSMEDANRLREALLMAHTCAWFNPFQEALLINGFGHVAREAFDATIAWDDAAKAAGYSEPA